MVGGAAPGVLATAPVFGWPFQLHHLCSGQVSLTSANSIDVLLCVRLVVVCVCLSIGACLLLLLVG